MIWWATLSLDEKPVAYKKACIKGRANIIKRFMDPVLKFVGSKIKLLLGEKLNILTNGKFLKTTIWKSHVRQDEISLTEIIKHATVNILAKNPHLSASFVGITLFLPCLPQTFYKILCTCIYRARKICKRNKGMAWIAEKFRTFELKTAKDGWKSN